MQALRKRELTELEHRACDAIKKLRKEMGLSLAQFARQIGANDKTLWRWEHHQYAPTRRHLVRLRQLQEMQANPDERDRIVPVTFRIQKPKALSAGGARLIARPMLVVLVRRAGGDVLIEEHDVKAERETRPLIYLDGGRYHIKVRPRQERKPT